MRALLSFWRRSWSERWMVLKAIVLVSGMRAALSVVRFQTLLRWIDRWSTPPHQPQDPAERRRILWAVSAVARRLLGDKPCLTQALVVQFLFQRRGYPANLRIGVTKDEAGTFKAHAWIESEGDIVIGGRSSPQQYRAFPALHAPTLRGDLF